MSLTRSSVGLGSVALVFSLAAAACSDDAPPSEGLPSSGATGGSGSLAVGGSMGTAGSRPIGTGGSIPVGSGGSAAAGSGTGGNAGSSGNGTPEVCDGLDNDGNGITDDVDAGGDGVCDCLNIGTIGAIGPWSDGGNIFASWLDARTPQGAVELGDQELTSTLLAPLQVIVVLHAGTMAIENDGVTAPAHHAFSDAEAAAFAAWVENGGGVMTTIGYYGDEAQEVVNVNRLLAPAGLGYSTTRLELTNFVQRWESHPVTMGVTNIFTDNGVEPDGTGTDVAWGGEDRVALEVKQVQNGRVVVWGDEWITYDSEWEDVRDQQVELFWLNVLKWLSPPTTCQVPIPPDIVR
jgi:hypothetical protein